MMRPMGENEKARALGYLDGRAGRQRDETIPVAQHRAYSEGFDDGEFLKQGRT